MENETFDVRLCGPPQLSSHAGVRHGVRNKTVALIAYLAYEARPIGRDTLATLLWPFSGQSSARGNLRTVIHEAAKALPQGAILSGSDTLQLSQSHVDIDLWDFLDAALYLSETPPPLEKLVIAAEICRGRFIEGFTLPDCTDFDSWQLIAADTIQRKLAVVLAGIANAWIRSGDAESAIDPATRLVSLDPFEESSHRLAMMAYARCGRWAAASEQFDSCARMLAEEFGCDPEESTIQLADRVKSRSICLSEEEAGSHLITDRFQKPPVPSNRFFGRAGELNSIKELLRSGKRLITIIGPAGIGKTRLAAEAVHVFGSPTIEASAFVDLTKTAESSELHRLIASSIGLQQRFSEQSDMMSMLVDHLDGRRLLLILDNFEHLIQAASAISDLVQSTKVIQVLVTSREPLRIQGEAIIRLNPLKVSKQVSLTSVRHSESAQLFAERAKTRLPDFSISEENYRSIQSICLALDCVPLALELCASLLPVYALEELPDVLKSSFVSLSGDNRDLIDRHRNYETALDWSFNLLTLEERRLFVGLSVFNDGFDVEAAQSVCGNGDIFVDTFRALLEKSLVISAKGAKQMRFRLLQVTREYAIHRLSERQDVGEMSERHAFHYHSLALKAEPELHRHDQVMWIDRLEADHANILLASSYLMEHNHVDAALETAIALTWFWFCKGYFRLGRERLLDIISATTTRQTRLYATALHNLGWLTFVSGNWREAHGLCSKSLYLAQRLKDRQCQIYALSNLGVIERWLGNVERGTEYCLAAVDAARDLDSTWLLTRSLIWLYASTGGDFDWCYPEAELKEAAELAVSAGDAWMLAHAHAGLGELFCQHGKYDRARASLEEALRGFSDLNERFLSAWVLEGLGNVEAGCGNSALALRYMWRSLELFDQLGDELNAGLVMARFANAARKTDRNENIAVIAGAASRMINKRWGDDLTQTPQVEQALHSLVGLDHEFPSEWIRGMSLSRAEAVELLHQSISVE